MHLQQPQNKPSTTSQGAAAANLDTDEGSVCVGAVRDGREGYAGSADADKIYDEAGQKRLAVFREGAEIIKAEARHVEAITDAVTYSIIEVCSCTGWLSRCHALFVMLLSGWQVILDQIVMSTCSKDAACREHANCSDCSLQEVTQMYCLPHHK
jgi:hypothetical protein